MAEGVHHIVGRGGHRVGVHRRVRRPFLPRGARARAGRVAQNHDHLVGTGGYEVAARGQCSEDDALERIVLPCVIAVVVFIVDGNRARQVVVDVGHSGSPGIGSLAVVVQPQLVVGHVHELFQCIVVDYVAWAVVATVQGSLFGSHPAVGTHLVVDGHQCVLQRHGGGHHVVSIVAVGVLLVALYLECIVLALLEQRIAEQVGAVLDGWYILFLLGQRVEVGGSIVAEETVVASVLPYHECGRAVVGGL